MVNGGQNSRQQAAPGALEQVRELLNTWLIPNHTRRPTDQFSDYAQRRHLARADQVALRQLRDDLRAAVEREPSSDERINSWIHRLELRAIVQDGALSFHHSGRPAGELLVAVVQAITNRQWERLKACPDCRWVFYDHTRNASKRWCLMNAGGPDGRSCGTIAKVRRHRQARAAREDP
jgi:hypothetical protein